MLATLLQTSNVLKTNCIRLATTDGFSEVPVTAICSSCKVFTGNLQHQF